VAQYIGSKAQGRKFSAVFDDDERGNKDDIMNQHEEALKRLVHCDVNIASEHFMHQA